MSALRITIATLGMLLAIGACHRARHGSGPSPDQGDDVSHAVHSVELRQTMNRLDEMQLKTWPQELQAEYASKDEYAAAKAFWEARRLAEGLAGATVTIRRAVDNTSISEVDRRSFLAQVETLREQAVRLERAAALGDRENMRRVLVSIDATCLSCHERFRDISGPLSSD